MKTPLSIIAALIVVSQVFVFADTHSKDSSEKNKNRQRHTDQAGKQNDPVQSEKEQSGRAKNRDSDKSKANKQTIASGDLSKRIASSPRFAIPPQAKAAGASGPVKVRVEVDENGRVLSATALSGHPMLREAAAKAARTMKFTPTLLQGQSVKTTGTIVVTPSL